MIKRLIVFLSIAAIVTSGIIFYWPQSFTKVIDENAGVYVQYSENVYGEFGSVEIMHLKTDIIIEPGTQPYEQFMDILRNYSYHRSLRTLFGGSSIKGGGNEFVHISHNGFVISNIGSKEILIGSRVYHLGYWGNKKAQAMISDIKAYIQGKNL